MFGWHIFGNNILGSSDEESLSEENMEMETTMDDQQALTLHGFTAFTHTVAHGWYKYRNGTSLRLTTRRSTIPLLITTLTPCITYCSICCYKEADDNILIVDA